MKASLMEDGLVLIDCPGCKHAHGLSTKVPNGRGSIWKWNGSLESPTFNPSLFVRIYRDNKDVLVCHSFIRDGKIQFLDDSTHSLAGQTVELPVFE